MKFDEWFDKLRKEELEYWSIVLKYAKKTVNQNKAKKMVRINTRKF